MINWEELKHIHVIRKLEEILGQWFNTEIFFVDERGAVRNFDPLDRQREFKNPLCATLLPKEKGREWLLPAMAEACDRLSRAGQAHMVVGGPVGLEKFVVSRIQAGNDFMGCVVAFSYIEGELSADQRTQARKKAESRGLDGEAFEAALARMKVLSDGQQKYFHELVDLVAQEIVTFHTEFTKRDEKIHDLSSQLGQRYSYDQMIGKSKPMQDLYSLLDKIRNSDSTVLVQGENGTGKELLARAIHFNSPRKGMAFQPVNCSALTDTLLESELFGHVKGAFTGAIKDKKGLLESADKGTLFLDEIGDMSPTMQVKLLRVLQQGEITPVGSTEVRKVDVRVLAATNRDLKEMVEQGTFREDLFYRINVINLVVPPLRDRKEDIPLLLETFLTRECKEKGVAAKQFAKRALEKVFDYPWPGNIRELENEVERLVVLSGEESKIQLELLSQRIRDWGTQGKVQGVRVAGKLKDAIDELEKTMIKEGLRRTNWNKSRLSKELGISRASLIMKVEKYGLDKRKLARTGTEG